MVRIGYCRFLMTKRILALVYEVVPHRDFAAFFAIAFRFAGESASALAFPPLAPPSFPRATAAGFLPAFLSSNGEPSSFSPMACSTMLRAIVAKS